MNRFRRTAILATAAVALVAAPLASASANEFHRYERWHHHRHHDDAGVAIAAGVMGLAAGAIIGDALATTGPGPAYPPPAYVPAPGYISGFPTDYYPPAPKATSGGHHGPRWRRACALVAGMEPLLRQPLPTFDPRTGTYRGYDGHDHFCVGP